jgi:1-acyl-sn-glycerol-3-phosphate acyltransferase
LNTLVAALRSLAFYVLFYGGSVLLVIASVVAVLARPGWLRGIVGCWGGWHLWWTQNLRGERIHPVLVGGKHLPDFWFAAACERRPA